jgi:hypothetical protein
MSRPEKAVILDIFFIGNFIVAAFGPAVEKATGKTRCVKGYRLYLSLPEVTGKARLHSLRQESRFLFHGSGEGRAERSGI